MFNNCSNITLVIVFFFLSFVGNYGLSGIQEFSTMAEEEGICEAKTEMVVNNADDEAYNDVIKHLMEKPKARVVVCFCEGMTVNGLLKATVRLGVEGKFLFIGR